VCYGYRVGEVPLADVGSPKMNTVFLDKPFEDDLSKRPITQVSAGCHVAGVALPHADNWDRDSLKKGAVKRVASQRPAPVLKRLKGLKHYTRRWCFRHLRRLAPDTDLSVEHWLELTSYTEKRKEELRKCWRDFTSISDEQKRAWIVRAFGKDEWYAAYKHTRGIYARSDIFKCLLGPIFKAIEHEVYQTSPFIKKVPVCDRPHVIMRDIVREGCEYYATDFTSFESSFSKQIYENCEFQMYDYMTSKLPTGGVFMDLLRKYIAGRNEISFRGFTMALEACRMSGEMNTSLGNGFTNLMVFHYLAKEVCGCNKVRGKVEGDDGIFALDGNAPSSEDFASLGFDIKIEKHTQINTASFCGIVFDVKDRCNIRDPRPVLASFSWMRRQYARAGLKKLKMLLRCKALSLAHQYPGCPIIQSLADYGLRVTRSFDIRHYVNEARNLNWWEREQLLAALHDEKKIRSVEPSVNSRLLMQEMYGISLAAQSMVESYLKNLDVIEPLQIQHVIAFDDCWRHYFYEYSDTICLTVDRLFERPLKVWVSNHS
jgi:hypothetical protein